MFKRMFALMGVTVFGLMAVVGLLAAAPGTAPGVRAAPAAPMACNPVTFDILTHTVWSDECYRIMTSTVTVQADALLTIWPTATTRIEFEPNSQLQVLGGLRALGTGNHPITFTLSNITSTPPVTTWVGIILEQNSGFANLIQYSTIQYSRSGIRINNAKFVTITDDVFLYNGENGSRDAAIGGLTDYSLIANNTIYSATNGILLGKSSYNHIVSNTISNVDVYGVAFLEDLLLLGGDNNTVLSNTISNSGQAGLLVHNGSNNLIQGNDLARNGGEGLRLDNGTSNSVLSNSIYLNLGGGVYLSAQGGASVQYNHVYSNGGGGGYLAAIYITGTPDLLANNVSFNTIYDEREDAIEYSASNGDTPPFVRSNALCSVPKNELRNDDDVTIDARYDWWGTNVPVSGTHYAGLVNLSPWITLSLITTTADLSADGLSTSVITISLRDATGRTVPPASTRQTIPPAPNPRRVELTATMGAISPSVVYVGDDGYAVATLTSEPRTGTALISATAFCNYFVSVPVRFAATNLAITKTALVTQVIPGDALAYRITYSNTSGIAANDVRITDTLPSGSTWASDTAAALGWARIQTSPQVVYTRTSLPPGAQESFVLTATVASATCSQRLTNTVFIGTRTIEDVTTDNSASDGWVQVICADVTIAKTTALTRTVPGDLITYTISYSNVGSAVANGVAITDVLPSGARYLTDTSGLPCPACAAGSTGPLVWSVPSPLPISTPYAFDLILRVDRNPALCNASLVNGVSIATMTPESNTTNNSAQAGAISAICADVWISKTTSVTQTVAGGLIPYTISYGNSGLASAENSLITDTLPAGTRHVTSSLPCPSCAPGATGPLTWAVGTLPPSSSYSFTLTLQVDLSTANCNFVVPPNAVVITTTTPETNTSNNSTASPSVRSECPVDLVVLKDDDVGPSTQRYLPGERVAERWLREAKRLDPQAVAQHRDFIYEGDLVTYTIAVVNVGTITATNAVLTETLPQYTTFVTGSGWVAATPITYVLIIPMLPPGDGRIYYFVVRVNDPVTGDVSSLINLVCGMSAESDRNPADNCSYEDTPIRRQPLRISKWAQCVVPGRDFSYWMIYTNTAATTFGNVWITDTLPISATYTGDINDWICAGSLYCAWMAPTVYPGTGVKALPIRLDRNYPYNAVTNTIVISNSRPFTLVTPVDRNPDLAVVKNDNIGPLPLEQQQAWEQMQRLLFSRAQSEIYQAQAREYAQPGERITYTILYVNNGVSSATNVVLTETLPNNTTYVGGGWTYVGGRSYIISLGTLGPQQGGQVEFIVRVNDPFPCSSNRVVNRVDIGGGQSECDLTNNWSADHTPITGCTPIQIYLPIILRQTEPITPVVVAFSRSNYYVWETMGVATITVVLDQPSTQTVTVQYSTSDGTAKAGLDYITSTGTLTFAAGATSATFPVRVLVDAVTETLETVNLTLSNPVNAAIGQPHPATLTIVDPCPPTPPNCAPAIWCVIPSESSPMGMAYDSAAGRLFVANQGGPSGGNLTIHQNDGLPLGTIDGLIDPQGVALDNTRGRNRAYVVGANWLHIVELSATTPYVMATLEVGVGEDVGAYSVAYNPNTDLIYVTGYRDNSVTVIHAETWHILRRLTGFHEPSYTAVNTATNKVYVSNHTGGNPWGFVSVISGTDKIGTVYLSGDLYGISVDNTRNRIYVASISVARVYVIDGRTDMTMGDIQIVRASDARPVPLRQTAVNPRVVTDTHLWLTSSSGDLRGMDRLILLSLPQSDWPPATPLVLRSTPVAASPEGGLIFDPNPASWRVFASSAFSNLVTVSRDNANLCPDPLAMSRTDEDSYYVVTHDYSFRRHNR